MKNLVFISIILSSFYTHGQMVNASLFGEMRSLNPAVISERKSGQMTGIVSKLTADKTQDVDGDEQKVKIDVTDFSFFRGGKGGGTTSEFAVRKSAGTYVRKTSDGEEKTKADLTYASFGVGFGSIGFSGFYNKFDYRSDEATERSLDQVVTIIDLKAGIKFKYIALTAELLRSDIVLPEAEEEESSPGKVVEDEEPKATIGFLIGAGIGFSSGASHFEFSAETTPTAMEDDAGDGSGAKKSVRPMRLSGTAEFKLWGITLGYTGRAYMNGFEDPELILNNRLIFPTRESMRLEHNINFALGGSSGLAISGSASLSESKNEEPKSAIDPQELKYATTTKLMVVSVKVGYAW